MLYIEFTVSKRTVILLFSTKVNRIWDLLAGMVHHGKEAFTKVHTQAQKESKKFTKKVSEQLYMVSHLSEMRRLRKLQRELEGSSGLIELILQKE